jgi:hypothetical protein
MFFQLGVGVDKTNMQQIMLVELIAPSILEIPARCRLNIARSTEPPE